MSYAFFMTLAFVSAAVASRLTSKRLSLLPSQRIFIGLSAFCGAMLFAKLPFWILGDNVLQHAGSLLMSGKSVLFGLVGGYAGVELAKRYLRVPSKTGDYFVVPVAVGIGVGRLGCFFSGCCFGTPTSLPWGVVFSAVDALARHPIQIYECVFHLLMAVTCGWLRAKKILSGQLIKLYFLTYFVFRFFSEFLRPEIDVAWGLSVYQWSILLLFPIFVGLWIRDARICAR